MNSGLSSANPSDRADYSGFSETYKHNGLVKIAFLKRTRNLFFRFFTYIENVIPNLFLLQEIVGILRLFHLYLVSLVPSNNEFYEKKTIITRSVEFIASIFLFSSPTERFSFLFSFINYYNLFSIFILIIFLPSLLYFYKLRKIPILICFIMYIYFYCLFFLLNPILIQYYSDFFGLLIGKHQILDSLKIFSVLISFFFLFFSIFLYIYVYSASILFKCESLSTVTKDQSIILYFLTLLITFVLGISNYFTTIVKFFFFLIAIFFFIIIILFTFRGASFILNSHIISIQTFCICSILNLIFITISFFLNIKAQDSLVTFILITLICSYIISSFLVEKIRINHLVTLDFLENKGLDDIEDEATLLALSLTGFLYSHPFCLSYKIFQLGLDKWSTSMDLFFVYAKFSAIYPEEIRNLEWIKKNIQSLKLKGSLAKFTLMQIGFLIQLREMNLSPSLKFKLNKLSRSFQNSKQKLRNIWDLVIQGNIFEMGNRVDRAFLSIKKTKQELDQLLNQYPNNRFVVRSFAFFYKEIEGNYGKFSEWIEKVKLIQRGNLIFPDRFQEFGLNSFLSLPRSQKLNYKNFQSLETEIISSAENDIDEENTILPLEKNTFLTQKIEKIEIPAIKWSIIILLGIFFILIIFPPIFLYIYYDLFISEITIPLDLMYSISLIRSINSQLSSFSMRLVTEQFIFSNSALNYKSIIDLPGFVPTNIGNSSSTIHQVQSLAKNSVSIIQPLNKFRSFNLGDPIFDEIRQICFSKSINYLKFDNRSSNTTIKLSVQDILIDSAVQITKIISNYSINNLQLLLSPINNRYSFNIVLNNLLKSLTIYFINNDISIHNTLDFISYLYISFLIIIVYLFLFLSLHYINKEKLFVYECLVSLPKGVVGSIVETLRSIKKEGTEASKSTESDSELSKQEENIIKIFSNFSTERISQSNSKTLQILCFSILLLLSIGNFLLIIDIFYEQSHMLQHNSPHIDFLLGVNSDINNFFLSAFSNILVLNNYSYWMNYNLNSEYSYIENINNLRYNFHQIVFGGSDEDEKPYIGIEEGKKKFSQYLICEKKKETNHFLKNLLCGDPNSHFYLLESLIQKISLINEDNYDNFSDNSLINDGYFLGCLYLYDIYFFPMFDSIVLKTKNYMESLIHSLLSSILVVFIIIFFLIYLIIDQLIKNRDHIIFCISLFLHCPTSIISQSAKIMNVLSGFYSSKNDEITNRNSNFFSNLVQNLNNPILVINNEETIISGNKSFFTLFKQSDNIIGSKIQAVLNSIIHFDSLEMKFNNLKNEHIKININENEINYFLMNTNIIQNYIVYHFIDETKEINYKILIEEEKNKSDKMLCSILPYNLVNKVQNGEKNISFSIQSASVIFIDIVEFTPWCSSNSASNVMKVLNLIFKEFDQAISFFPTLSKIKCIGDCYMAAGGIFTEINQPVRHAKESVDFCLKAIKIINNINQRLNENLQIRIGINTGGPIVAGVLGTSKPTFEILGPVINFAQQMEHHGIPMNIHISRSVYELIYGSNYNVRERGQIEIKSEKYYTYLVIP